MRRLAIFVSFAFALCAAATAQGTFGALEGSWAGGGWAIAKPGAPKEAVRCRIRATVGDGGTRVNIAGQCAAPGNRTAVDGYLTRLPDGSFRGRWSNPRGLGTIGLTGRGSSSEIRLIFTAENRDTGKPVSGTMIWSIGEKEFSISGSMREAGDAASTPTGLLEFTR
jgi:hypothetical protein